MYLDRFSNFIGKTPGLLKSEIKAGDQILIKTQNSIYKLSPGKENYFRVSGGIFDRDEQGMVQTTIAGCTWGGSCLKHDAIAVCGLRLEFGNKIVTSTITAFAVFKAHQLN